MFMQKTDDRKTEDLKKVIMLSGIGEIALFVNRCHLMGANLIILTMTQEGHGKQTPLMLLM